MLFVSFCREQLEPTQTSLHSVRGKQKGQTLAAEHPQWFLGLGETGEDDRCLQGSINTHEGNMDGLTQSLKSDNHLLIIKSRFL